MILLPLLVCVLLGALSAQAKVVDTFAECNKFFYKGTEPAGMDQNAKKICQKLNNRYHYATLYSTHHRIPVYSAYIFDPYLQSTPASRTSWFIEPQISMEGSDNMMPETRNNKEEIKGSQAINSDYSKTGYDRGHLNPNCYQCGREATFTLTNAAPMNPRFNQVHWYKWEKGVKDFLKANTVSTVYLVTGTVPHPNKRIPQREESAQEQSSDEYERVTVPTHIWTAVCYIDPYDKDKSFSFGYIGRNVADTSITMMPVANLNSQLAQLYQPSGIKQAGCNLRIFVDECYCSSRKYEEILKIIIQLTELQNISNLVPMPAKYRCSEIRDSKKQSYFSIVDYSSMTVFSKDLENMKRNTDRACVLTKVHTSHFSDTSSDLRKRDLDQGSDAVECQQVTEKSDPTAMTTADGTRCQNLKHFCETKDGFKPCCSTPCLYQETRKDYWCRSGQIEIQCSPQYSSITVNGEKCKDDHQCGTYGKDYYWCKTKSSWDYCSPPFWKSKTIDQKDCRSNHACAKYGKSYTWCYTDFDNNWNYCCNHDDCYSARDGKTCKSDHKCGYHGKGYLWCYTTDGSWEKCCTPCQ